MARIGIGIDDALRSYGGGVGVLIRSLVQDLCRENTQHEFFLVYSGKNREVEFVSGENVHFCQIPISSRILHRILWPLFGWPLVEKFTGPLEIFHNLTSGYQIPSHAKEVVTVLDLFPELYPNYFKWTGRILRKSLLRQMKRAAHLVAISQTVRDEAIEYLNVKPEKISTIYHSVSREFLDAQEDSTVFQEIGVDVNKFFLFAGRIHWRKNTDNLLRALSIYHAKYGKKTKLVLAGSHSTYAEQFLSMIEDLGLKDTVIVTGYLPLPKIKALFRNAIALLYPSRHEGFGYPILEAYSVETPVVTATAGALPETAGNGALFVDPEKPEELSDAMHTISDDLVLRTQLIKNGIERLKFFQHINTAKQYLEIYDKVLSL